MLRRAFYAATNVQTTLRFTTPLSLHRPRVLERRCISTVTLTYLQGILPNDCHKTVELVDKLRKSRTADVARQALEAAGVPSPDTSRWVSCVLAPNVASAMELLTEGGMISPLFAPRRNDALEDFLISQPPTWLVAHLLANKVKNAQDTIMAMELMYHHLPACPAPWKPTILLLSAASLSKYGMAAPWDLLIRAFVSLDPIPSAPFFNLLLRQLSLLPCHQNNAFLVGKVLEAMNSQHMEVSHRTFDCLLRPAFIDTKIVRLVEYQMNHQGIQPSFRQLRSILRLMSRTGRRKLTARYITQICDLLAENESLATFPSQRRHSTWNIKFLRSWHLTSMRSVSRVYRTITHAGRTRSTGDGENGGVHSHGTTMQLSDWTAMIYVAGRDKSVSAAQLIALFRDGVETVGIKPTMFAYSVVIRGLLYKWDVPNALKFWKEARQIGFVLDTVSVGNGVAALTLGGEAHNAFALLEDVYREQTKENALAKVNSYAVHQFMISLQRMGRPDLVFEIWDSMEALYGIPRDTYTFNIMLKSARWAKKLNSNLRVALETSTLGIAVRRLTQGSQTASADTSREAICDRITKALDTDRRAVPSGLWNGEPAARAALQVARDVFLGNWPALRFIRPPVKALRQSRDGPALNPLRDLYDSLTSPTSDPLDNARAVQSLVTESNTSLYRYPEIIPSDVTFRTYFDLLAAEEQIPEIPLALAWMRELGIKPSPATLATALVYFAQVGSDAPLIESVKGGPNSSPYSQLVRWMVEWVGEERMPRAPKLGWEAQRVDFYWRSDYAKILEDRHKVTWESEGHTDDEE